MTNEELIRLLTALPPWGECVVAGLGPNCPIVDATSGQDDETILFAEYDNPQENLMKLELRDLGEQRWQVLCYRDGDVWQLGEMMDDQLYGQAVVDLCYRNEIDIDNAFAAGGWPAADQLVRTLIARQGVHHA